MSTLVARLSHSRWPAVVWSRSKDLLEIEIGDDYEVTTLIEPGH